MELREKVSVGWGYLLTDERIGPDPPGNVKKPLTKALRLARASSRNPYFDWQRGRFRRCFSGACWGCEVSFRLLSAESSDSGRVKLFDLA